MVRSGIRKNPADLSLGELDTTASTVQPVLLALFHAAVSGQKSLASQRGEQFAIMTDQCACDPHPAGSGLSRRPTAIDPNHNIHDASLAHRFEHLGDRTLILFDRKEIFQRTVVDRDLARTRSESNSSHCGLASPRPERVTRNLIFLYRYHSFCFTLNQLFVWIQAPPCWVLFNAKVR